MWVQPNQPTLSYYFTIDLIIWKKLIELLLFSLYVLIKVLLLIIRLTIKSHYYVNREKSWTKNKCE